MRYILLVLLNLPVVLLALVNLVTKYKTKKITRNKFNQQILLWAVITLVIVSSFPVYNLLVGRHPFESSSLSLFDIVETTVLIFLIYVVNNMRQKIEWSEKRIRDLHQELSIKLSMVDDAKNTKHR